MFHCFTRCFPRTNQCKNRTITRNKIIIGRPYRKHHPSLFPEQTHPGIIETDITRLKNLPIRFMKKMNPYKRHKVKLTSKCQMRRWANMSLLCAALSRYPSTSLCKQKGTNLINILYPAKGKNRQVAHHTTYSLWIIANFHNFKKKLVQLRVEPDTVSEVVWLINRALICKTGKICLVYTKYQQNKGSLGC